MVWLVLAWLDRPWFVEVRSGKLGCDMVGFGLVRLGATRLDTAGHGKVWCVSVGWVQVRQGMLGLNSARSSKGPVR